MRQSKKIAITGGISSGKSLVSEILTQMGEICISCDKLNAELLSSNEYLNGLKALFPESFTNGMFNRALLKETIFYSEEKRKALNKYSHNKIKQKMLNEMAKYSDKRVFVEVPLLNQTDFINCFDEVWVVMATEELQIKRIMYRDNVTEEFATKILQSQVSDYKFPIATEFIHNTGSIIELRKKVEELLK